MSKNNMLREPQDFSLVLGGPLFQLLRRSHLAGDALELVRQRIIVISLFAWLPLLVLSALEGRLLGGRVAVPFLQDLEVHIKFLLVTPLLIAAELVVHERMRFVVRQFLERNLIPQNALPRFDAAVASAFRLRNSVLAEVLLGHVAHGSAEIDGTGREEIGERVEHGALQRVDHEFVGDAGPRDAVPLAEHHERPLRGGAEVAVQGDAEAAQGEPLLDAFDVRALGAASTGDDRGERTDGGHAGDGTPAA